MAVKPSAEDLERFEEVSPIAHVGAVTAPLLFMLGAKDRRWGWSLHLPEAGTSSQLWIGGILSALRADGVVQRILSCQ
jgi:hypothetical protein